MKVPRFLISYTIVGFLTNFFWESWHGVHLYAQPSWYTDSITNYIYMNTFASLQDATYLLAIFVITALIFQNRVWWKQLTWSKLAVYSGLAVGGALIAEVFATEIVHWWQYEELMPSVLGAGLSPLLQIMLTGLLTIFVLRVSCTETDRFSLSYWKNRLGF